MLKRATGYQVFRRQLSVPQTYDQILVDHTRLSSAFKISFTVDKAIYILFDDDAAPNVDNALELDAGAYNEDGIAISRWIRFVNRDNGEQPILRGIMWGE